LNDPNQQVLAPRWLAHRFDESKNEIRFVDYDRVTRSSVPFLTDDYLPALPFRSEPRARAKALAPASGPIHFVFHSGFCCSTLFAQCFDQPGLASTFSEPMILNDVVGWRKRGAAPAEVGRLLDDALSLLARPFEGDCAALIKPSTVANGLAAAMMRLRPDARAIVMWAPLDDFLTSIAKKGLDGRLWARELFMAMRKESLTQQLGFSDEQFFGQTDLQIAAAAWLGQQKAFARLIETCPDRVRSLGSDSFLANPAEALTAANVLFGLNISQDQVELARQNVLTRNSKDGKPFSPGARRAEYRTAHKPSAYGDEIDKVRAWAQAVADATKVTTELSAKLI